MNIKEYDPTYELEDFSFADLTERETREVLMYLREIQEDCKAIQEILTRPHYKAQVLPHLENTD